MHAAVLGAQVRHRPVAAHQRQIESEHLRFHREIEKQLAGPQPQLPRQPIFHAFDQIGIGRRPVAHVDGEIGGGHIERAFGEAPFAQRGGESCRIVGRQLVNQPVVGGHGNPLDVETARRERAAHQPLEHRGGAAHGVVPIDVAVHLVLREQQ